MPRISIPSDVQYLAFQGGGGKGYAYIGAIEALERLGVIGAKYGDVGTLRGISGTSVGAITAFLLAIGCRSKDLIEIFSDSNSFLDFFDGPDNGFARGITSTSWAARKDLRGDSVVKDVARASTHIEAFIRSLRDIATGPSDLFFRLNDTSTRLLGPTLAAIWMALTPAGQMMKLQIGAKGRSDDFFKEYPFAKPIFSNTSGYLYNLLYDRGIFPGFAVRNYLTKAANRYLPKNPRWKKQLPTPADITFSQLLDTTGVDFRVVGTNLSARRAQYFSAAETPHFSVIEAVGISSSFPMMFKPVWIDAHPRDPILGSLRGYWVDGGVLNNLPVHAFDSVSLKVAGKKVGCEPVLNPNVLGLSLVPGAPRSIPIAMPNVDDALGAFAWDLYETALMPSDAGQYSKQGEREQIIPIFSFALSLFDFSPSEATSKAPREAALTQVLDYFAFNRR